MTASEIVNRYEQALKLGIRTGKAFASEYEGSRLEVAFVVSRIDARTPPQVFVFAKEQPLICHFHDAAAQNAHVIAEGDTVQVICTIRSISRTVVRLDQCKVISLSIPDGP